MKTLLSALLLFALASCGGLPEIATPDTEKAAQNVAAVEVVASSATSPSPTAAFRGHHRGWGTDFDLLKVPGEPGYWGWWNYPDPDGGGTQIAHGFSRSGADFTSSPLVVLRGEDVPDGMGTGGVETPSGIRNTGRPGWDKVILAVLAKKYYSGGNRIDRIVLFHGPTAKGPFRPLPVEAFSPVLDWEKQWRTAAGKLTGGVQEPSLMMVGGVLYMWYTAHRYGPPYTYPTTGFAALLPGETKWSRWPTPVILNSGQINVQREGEGLVARYAVVDESGTNQVTAERRSLDGVNWGPERRRIRITSHGRIFGVTAQPGILILSLRPEQPNSNMFLVYKNGELH